ncbi:MAG TPA: amino acid decarboxylase [Bacillota bacterium]|nr:amino acid decarboxylase [Bacillota bacterium]
MLEINQEGNVLSIDVRPAFHAGMHPKEQILQTIRETSTDLDIEIHLPHPGTPLIPILESLGLQVHVKPIATDHFCLVCTHKNTPSK